MQLFQSGPNFRKRQLALEHVLRLLRIEPGEAFYWSTHAGAELDLMLVRGKRRWGFEFKYADAPRTTRCMRAALDDLKLRRLFIVYPGDRDYLLDDRIEVLTLPGVVRLAGRLDTRSKRGHPPYSGSFMGVHVPCTTD